MLILLQEYHGMHVASMEAGQRLGCWVRVHTMCSNRNSPW